MIKYEKKMRQGSKNVMQEKKKRKENQIKAQKQNWGKMLNKYRNINDDGDESNHNNNNDNNNNNNNKNNDNDEIAGYIKMTQRKSKRKMEKQMR